MAQYTAPIPPAPIDHLKARLGLRETTDLLRPSPFRYDEQAVLYVPRRMPDPRDPTFLERAALEVRSLLGHSRGRAFVLFASYADMNAP